MDLTAAEFTLGGLITLGLFLIAVSNFFGGKKKTTQEDEARLVRIETKADNINTNTSDLKKRVDEHDVRLDEHGNRLTKVETKITNRRGGK